ncbi:MAG: DUF6316 family protein [Pseudomonadota bacterium]
MRKTDNPDQKRRYFRSSARTFQMNGSWYFAAREGEVGPFPTQKAAQLELVRYVADREQLESFQRAREQRVDKLAPRKPTLQWREERDKPVEGVPTLTLELT